MSGQEREEEDVKEDLKRLGDRDGGDKLSTDQRIDDIEQIRGLHRQ